MESDGRRVPVEAAAVAAQICGRDVRMWVRRQPVLAVCSPRAATISLHPDALLLAYRQLLAIVAQQGAHLATPWPVQLRARLRLVAPGTVIALVLLTAAVVFAR